MKFCPTCQTRYDEEILRFCTKDGTPLVEDSAPQFTELPSESAADDFGEETVIRRKPVSAPTQPLAEEIAEAERNSDPRIVIPTREEEPPLPPPVRPKTTESFRRHEQPRKSNTAKIVLLTVLGTLGILAAASGVFWLLSDRNSNGANQNINVNANLNTLDTNLNTNLNIGATTNFNSNVTANANSNAAANTNVSTNLNTNAKTPTPTPKPTASPTPTANTNASNSNLATPTVSPRPTATPPPSPTSTPQPTPTPQPSNRPVNAGVLNSRALNLPKPAYPPFARQARASGQVAVQVLVDEGGNILSAKATSGHPLLRAAAENAARQSRLNPVKIGDRNVKATGILLYNFINQ